MLFSTSVFTQSHSIVKKKSYYAYVTRAFFSGLLLPLGFAPFHFPGLAILGLALLFAQLSFSKPLKLKHAFFIGFSFGIGFFGFGVSWIYISIHDFGHLHPIIAVLITLLFIAYLALFPALITVFHVWICSQQFRTRAESVDNTADHSRAKSITRSFTQRPLLSHCFLFAALWTLGEYLRATLWSGFPWLLIGFSQMEAPLHYLLPLCGIYGVSFLAVLAGALFITATHSVCENRWLWISAGLALLLLPNALATKTWTKLSPQSISVGIVQANLSMHDKWDEGLFWTLLKGYKESIATLLKNTTLIVLPESAIPLPSNYLSDILEDIHNDAKRVNSAILLGIPKPVRADDTSAYYNAMLALGKARGSYFKQHLVPFGEYAPLSIQFLFKWLNQPIPVLRPGKSNQNLIEVHKHPIASLVCYELAYPTLLRAQLPKAEWIVSISDDGWFGHSLAMHQHRQIAQALSIQTGRYQILANNDGLSSVLNDKGEIVASLPAFTAGTLRAELHAAEGETPWTRWGDAPILYSTILIIAYAGLKTGWRAAKIRV